MNSLPDKQYKCLPFLLMLFISLSILIRLFGEKPIWTDTIRAGYLLSPFMFILMDIIAEVYGYKISMKIQWSLITSRLIFVFICWLLIKEHSPSNWPGQNGYNLTFKYMWDSSIINPFAYMVVCWINVYLITKWKILLKGKYFWLRSIGSSGIAEILFPIFCALIPPYIHPMTQTIQIILWITLFRFSFTIFFAFPSTIIVNIIKIIEKIDVYEHQMNFNPFKKPKSAETWQ